MARAVASAALSATDLATQDEKDGARRPGIRGKAAGARRRPRFAVAAVAAGLALAVGMGGYAYASGQLVSVASAFDDVTCSWDRRPPRGCGTRSGARWTRSPRATA